MRGRGGAVVRRHIAPARSKMIRSDDFEALMERDLKDRPGLRRLSATVGTVTGLPDGTAGVAATDATGARVRLSARWVFDSRPPERLPAARTRLLQHFRGWFVRTERPVFEPEVVDLMDFPRRSRRGVVSFGYVLPTRHRVYPETRRARVVAARHEWRADCPLFAVGGYRDRPTVRTPDPAVVVAGDLVRTDLPVALMERAATSGFLAANALLERWGVRGETLWTVPDRGRSAPLRALARRFGAR
ncbi:hypothetical protein SVIOM342S_03537 [Streptomyces violaceorubidus]